MEEEGEVVEDGRAERSLAIGGREQAANSLTPYLTGHVSAPSHVKSL